MVFRLLHSECYGGLILSISSTRRRSLSIDVLSRLSGGMPTFIQRVGIGFMSLSVMNPRQGRILHEIEKIVDIRRSRFDDVDIDSRLYARNGLLEIPYLIENKLGIDPDRTASRSAGRISPP